MTRWPVGLALRHSDCSWRVFSPRAPETKKWRLHCAFRWQSVPINDEASVIIARRFAGFSEACPCSPGCSRQAWRRQSQRPRPLSTLSSPFSPCEACAAVFGYKCGRVRHGSSFYLLSVIPIYAPESELNGPREAEEHLGEDRVGHCVPVIIQTKTAAKSRDRPTEGKIS